MVKKYLCIIFLNVFLMSFFFGREPDLFNRNSFPEIEGLKFDGETEIYYPDSLFEYIDGAADQFLTYKFKVLFSKNYKGIKNEAVTVDVYEHGDMKNAFGIYSQEKPDKGNFIRVGTQGYYEDGILNFFKGKYYVKISGFDLGKDCKNIILKIGKRVSGNLTGDCTFPSELGFFPEEKKISGSEKYVSRNFLGYPFLNSVFTCRYGSGDKITEMFVISSKDGKDSMRVVEKYRNYLKQKSVSVKKMDSGYLFPDPNYKREGNICLRIFGRYIVGVFCRGKPDFTLLNEAGKIINGGAFK